MRRVFLALILLLCSPPSLAETTSESDAYLERSASVEKWFFQELPHHLGNDLKETVWNRWHLLALAAGTGATIGIHQADSDIQEPFRTKHYWGGADAIFDLMGNSLIMGGGLLVTVAAAHWADAAKARLTGETMLEAFFLNQVFTYALKFSVQRERPDASNHLSFPSSHTSNAFTLATVTESFFGPWYGVPAYLLAGAIAFSRIDSNQHFASDTAAGALLGMMLGLGTAQFHKQEKQELFVLPEATESGIMIHVAKLF